MSDKIDLPVWDTVREPTVEIVTSGSIIKPFADVLGQFLDEARLHCTEQGISVRATDASNVVMVDAEIPRTAFDEYDVAHETVVGVDVSSLRGCVRRARMHSDDILSLRISPDEVRSQVSRDNMITTDAMRTFDPDSMRDEPHLPNLTESDDYNYAAVEFEVDRFAEGVNHVLDATKYVKLGTQSGRYIMESETDNVTSGVRFEDIEPENEFTALFSGDLMESVTTACKKTRAETATVWGDDDAPLFIDIERKTNAGKVLDTTLMLAPRIRK